MTTRQSKSPPGEFHRNTWHACFGLVCLLFFCLQIERRTALLIFGLLTFSYGALDWYRLRDPKWNAWFTSSSPLSAVLLPEEHECMTNVFCTLLGALFANALFSRQVATLALLWGTWCVPASVFLGRQYGSKQIKSKSRNQPFLTAKSIAMAVIASVITLFFLLCTANNFDGAVVYLLRILSTAALGGIIAAVSEAVSILAINSATTMPILAGTCLSLFTPITFLYTHEI